jgi:DNA-binding PadR family transcriptional regulator
VQHVILGLLLMGDQTLYSLKKQFEAGISLFYSASVGSIKRALDALVAQRLIDMTAAPADPRGKKIYAITSAGRSEFAAWMVAPVAGTDAETTALARTFFLGLLPPDERGAVLRAIIERVEGDLAELRAVAAHLDTLELPAEARDIFTHQRATLDYGIGSHEFALSWFRAHEARLS